LGKKNINSLEIYIWQTNSEIIGVLKKEPKLCAVIKVKVASWVRKFYPL